MDLVGAALDDGVEHAAGGAAEFGAELVLHRSKLGYGFVGDVDQRTGGVVRVVLDAVDVEGVVLRALAGDAEDRCPDQCRRR